MWLACGVSLEQMCNMWKLCESREECEEWGKEWNLEDVVIVQVKYNGGTIEIM